MKNMSFILVALIGLVITIFLGGIYLLITLLGFNDASNFVEVKQFNNIVIPLTLISGPLLLLITYIVTVLMAKSSLASGKSIVIPIVLYFVSTIIIVPALMLTGVIAVNLKADPYRKKADERMKAEYPLSEKKEVVEEIVRTLSQVSDKEYNQELDICIYNNEHKYAIVKKGENCNSVSADQRFSFNSKYVVHMTDSKPKYNLEGTREIYIQNDSSNKLITYHIGDGLTINTMGY